MEITKDFIVTKSNKLIHTKHGLNLNEQKIVLILTSLIHPEDKEFTKYEISIKELANVLNISSQNLYRDIPKITKNLMTKVLEFRENEGTNEEELIQVHFLSVAKYSKKTGTVKLGFSEEMKPYLLELKRLFVTYKLANALELTSKYAITIYEICKENAFKKSFIWDLEELRDILDLKQKTYAQYGKIKEKILNPVFTEISNKTDLAATFEEVKDGRKVVAIEITIKQKNEVKRIDPTDDVLKESALIEVYGNEAVQDAKAYTDTRKGVKHYWKYVEKILKEKAKEAVSMPKTKYRTKNEDEVNPLGFNNMKPREYDYDDLEKRLLGWDKDE